MDYTFYIIFPCITSCERTMRASGSVIHLLWTWCHINRPAESSAQSAESDLASWKEDQGPFSPRRASASTTRELAFWEETINTLNTELNSLSELEDVKDKLFHFDPVRFVWFDELTFWIHIWDLLLGHVVLQLRLVLPDIFKMKHLARSLQFYFWELY